MLSELAQEHELGNSLLERLFTHYKAAHPTSRVLQNHTASLLTNYRCHSSILTFTSSLFYEHTLLSRSKSETHPLAPYPLIFTCSSIDKQNLKSLQAENIHEAKVLVENALAFIRSWPASTKGSEDKPKVGLLASTREQVSCMKDTRTQYTYVTSFLLQFTKVQVIRRELNEQRKKSEYYKCDIQVDPTYLIQGVNISSMKYLCFYL